MLVEVKLYNEALGVVKWNDINGSATFQYNESALSTHTEPSPILMPIEGRTFTTNRDHLNFHNLPYLLSDSMPDDFGKIMMKEWLRQKSLTFDNINPVDRLTYVGIRGMGALEFQPINHKLNNDYNGIKNSKSIIEEVVDAVSFWPEIAIELDTSSSIISIIGMNLRTYL